MADTVHAAAELAKEWASLAVVAQQQQQQQQHSDSFTNSFVLAALLLGFDSTSSSTSVSHLSSTLLSMSEAGNFADIVHWCCLLSRRHDIAQKVICVGFFVAAAVDVVVIKILMIVIIIALPHLSPYCNFHLIHNHSAL